MERHTCKLCFRRFSSGRALGGHMRSHVTSAAAGAPPARAPEILIHHHQHHHDSSASSSSAAEEKAAMGLSYGLRENPRKSFRLVDPEFSSSFAAVAGDVDPAVGVGSSALVQDRESETESSPRPASHRHRSKRPRRRAPPPPPGTAEEPPEPEPVSSVSDTTPEEDVALCLMMLSRDIWTKTKSADDYDDDGEAHQSDGYDEEEEEQEEEAPIVVRSRPVPPAPRGRSRHQCGTCKKVFRSYQALGGHRASHKKNRGCIPAVGSEIHDADDAGGANADDPSKVHECPVCFRVFSSGQALGGHKRSHLIAAAAAAAAAASPVLPPPPSDSPSVAKHGHSFAMIDLNLPAPVEEDAELSAVSDAEFIAGNRLN